MRLDNLLAALGALTLATGLIGFVYYDKNSGKMDVEYEFSSRGLPARYETFKTGITGLRVKPRQIRFDNGDIMYEGVLTSDDGKRIVLRDGSFTIDGLPLD